MDEYFPMYSEWYQFESDLYAMLVDKLRWPSFILVRQLLFQGEAIRVELIILRYTASDRASP